MFYDKFILFFELPFQSWLIVRALIVLQFPRIQCGNYLLFPLLFQNKSSLLRICHCRTLEEKKIQFQRNLSQKKRKMSFILHNVVPNDFNTVADFEVFLLNWKNRKWRHQDAGLRRSVLSKSFVPQNYGVSSQGELNLFPP